jgi:membrane-associated protease RseP (regulator of RpoE activity)
MKAITIAVSSMFLVFLATGCASNKAVQQRGWIGGEFFVAKRSFSQTSEGQPIVPAFPKQLEGKQKAGVFVSSVYSNTPLAVAGIRAGDLILAVNGHPVEKLSAFHKIIDGSKPGSTVSLALFHNGQAEDRRVIIGRETYRNYHDFAMTLQFPPSLQLDLVPNPNFSLIALGYSRNQQRAEQHSPRNEFIRRTKAADQKESTNGAINGESWTTWLTIFSLGGYKTILSQETVEPSQASLTRP